VGGVGGGDDYRPGVQGGGVMNIVQVFVCGGAGGGGGDTECHEYIYDNDIQSCCNTVPVPKSYLLKNHMEILTRLASQAAVWACLPWLLWC